MTLTAFHDAVSLLLRGQIEKRNVLEALDLVLLAADETIDDGWVRLAFSVFSETLESKVPACQMEGNSDGPR
jgi:hypothetical protein